MRLIDADALMEKFNVFNDKAHGNKHFLYGIESAKELTEQEPTVGAVPVEYIHRRIETLNEYISKWGGSFDHEEMVNAYIHEVSALVRLIADWMKED